MSSLYKAKVMDVLLVGSGHYSTRAESVARLTTTQVVTAHGRYRKSDGRSVGHSRTVWARLATAEDLAERKTKREEEGARIAQGRAERQRRRDGLLTGWLKMAQAALEAVPENRWATMAGWLWYLVGQIEHEQGEATKTARQIAEQHEEMAQSLESRERVLRPYTGNVSEMSWGAGTLATLWEVAQHALAVAAEALQVDKQEFRPLAMRPTEEEAGVLRQLADDLDFIVQADVVAELRRKGMLRDDGRLDPAAEYWIARKKEIENADAI